jgi:Carboxypeptidase regulatory-like domain
MHRRNFLSSFVLLALFGLVLGTVSSSAQEKRGRKYKAPPPTSKIEVTVLKDFNGKPIENASVIFHTLNDPGNMELKSNEDGKATIDVLPIGETIRLQIIAKGYQTYGGDYKIEKDQMAIEIRMKRPGEQYSIYKDHAGDKKDDSADPNKDKPSESSKPQ